ncbi:hypothetical protein RSAG8_02859, partial [Rhizoctonia solani AG-8 WAC10335]
MISTSTIDVDLKLTYMGLGTYQQDSCATRDGLKYTHPRLVVTIAKISIYTACLTRTIQHALSVK